MFTSWEDIQKHWEIIKFTCGLMDNPNKIVKHVLQEYVTQKISELQYLRPRNRIRRSEMEALAEISRESKGKSVNLFCNEYFQYVTEQHVPFPSQLYYFGPRDYRYIMDRIPDVFKMLKINNLAAGKCAVIIYRPHLGLWEILKVLSSLSQFNQKIHAVYMTDAKEECPVQMELCLGNSLQSIFTEIKSFEVYSKITSTTSKLLLEQLQSSCQLEILSTNLTEAVNSLHLLKSLKRLDLSSYNQSVEQRLHMCQQLRHLSRLEDISLGGKSIGFGGAHVLAESIKSWDPDPPLIDLDLSICEIRQSGCVELLEALTTCKKLKFLTLFKSSYGHISVSGKESDFSKPHSSKHPHYIALSRGHPRTFSHH